MELRDTFDLHAAQYEKSRPHYCGDIVKTILGFKELNSSSAVLEVGCGTGQATELFVDLKARVHCIDSGENLLEIAKNKFSHKTNVEFFLCPYEDYASDTKYDLIFSATAYHWIRQPEGDRKTRELLKPGGLFSVFRNIPTHTEEGYFRDSQEIYKKYIPKTGQESRGKGSINTEAFELVHKAEFPWEETYDVDEYLGLISTYSDHISLPEDKRKGLFRELRCLITSAYGGKVRKTYATLLEIGKPR